MSRIKLSGTRPMLQTDDPRARMEAILRERESLYLGMADMIMDTGQLGLSRSMEAIYTNLCHENITR